MLNDLPIVDKLSDLKGKKVLLRIDANVPIDGDLIVDDFRLKQSHNTINFLKNSGAKVVLLSHHGGKKDTQTLLPVAKYFDIKLLPLVFSDENRNAIDSMKDGEMVILENLRFNEGEKNNSTEFAKQLSSLGDIFVNDAFSESHRRYSSIVGLVNFLPSYLGFLFKREIENLSSAFDAQHPFVVILGGVKFQTKVKLVEKFLNLADKIFIGGALCNTFYKKMGYETGISVVDKETIDLSTFMNNPKVILPKDARVISETGIVIKDVNNILPQENIVDNGPEFIGSIKDAVANARLVLWNGPLGNFEKGFTESTYELAKIISNSSAKTIIGGGDTLASIKSLNLFDKFTFISTGGGAMLDFLANGTLPGIEAVGRSH